MKTDEPTWLIYKSGTGNTYPLEFGQAICQIKDLVFDPMKTWKACATGCSNFNRAGGCPPRAPKLNSFTEKNDLVWIIYCRFWSKYEHERVAISNNPAIHWKFQDTILSSVLFKLGNKLVESIGGIHLGNGYCRGCPGKKCNFKIGIEECRNPFKRTYSMEATGINVVQTIKDIFGIELFWYHKGITKIPYMVKCIAILPPENKHNDIGKELLIDTLVSFKSLNKLNE